MAYLPPLMKVGGKIHLTVHSIYQPSTVITLANFHHQSKPQPLNLTGSYKHQEVCVGSALSPKERLGASQSVYNKAIVLRADKGNHQAYN